MSTGFFFQRPLENAEDLDPSVFSGDNEYARSVPGAVGPFENPPKVANLKIVTMVTMPYSPGGENRQRITSEHISAGVEDPVMKSQLRELNFATALPAGIRVVGSKIGIAHDMSDLFHVRVHDNKGRCMNTKHLCIGPQDTRDPRKLHIGYPLKLFQRGNDSTGWILDTNDKIPETFRQYVMLRKEHMLKDVERHKGVGGHPDTFLIDPNSVAASILFFVIVKRNSHISKIETPEQFRMQYADPSGCLRMPAHLVEEVQELVFDRMKRVQEKSYDCQSLEVEVQMIDIFREMHPEITKVPISLTLEINLHVPVHPGDISTVYTPSTGRMRDPAPSDSDDD